MTFVFPKVEEKTYYEVELAKVFTLTDQLTECQKEVHAFTDASLSAKVQTTSSVHLKENPTTKGAGDKLAPVLKIDLDGTFVSSDI
jgi:hypothetical protein